MDKAYILEVKEPKWLRTSFRMRFVKSMSQERRTSLTQPFKVEWDNCNAISVDNSRGRNRGGTGYSRTLRHPA